MTARTQLSFRFEHRAASSGEDFLVSPANADAVAWIDKWPDWPAPAVILHGPPGCGKSHLAQVFRSKTAATPLDLDGDAEPSVEPGGAWILDGIEPFFDHSSQERLFHVYNHLGQSGGTLLITATTPPRDWPLSLADLASRLRASPVVGIAPPDDALLTALLVKLFADRQIAVKSEVITYAVVHMERSFEAARELVSRSDDLALSGKRKVTIPLLREILADVAAKDP